MKNPVIIKILSVLVNLLIGFVSAILILYFQDWFGSDDTYSYLFWTIPLSIEIAIFGKSLLNLFPIINKTGRLLMILLIAVAISFVWVYAVYLILGPWISAFSIPVSLLWIVGTFFQLVFMDRFIQSDRTKTTAFSVLKIVLGFPIVFILCLLSMYGLSFFGAYLSRPKPETFLIPTNFKGTFRVIYGEACGIMPPTEKGRRLLRIPANRLLIIQPEFESGIIDHEYFFVDQNGKRTKIAPYENYLNGTKNIPGIRLGGSGSIGGLLPGGGFSSTSPLAIHYTNFHVYQDSLEKHDYNTERTFDSLTTALTEDCRKLKK